MQNFIKIIAGTLTGATFFFVGVFSAQANLHISAPAPSAPTASEVVGPPAPAPSAPLVPTKKEGVLEFGKFSINCGFVTGKPEDCLPLGVYYLVYKPASYLLIGSAYIFDALFPLSLSSQFINQPFIEDAWTIVRDFANMAFIFILLYVGISTMFGVGDWKKEVRNVVVIALFLNFSLFFTKVIIDTGNIFALGIYNQMGAVSTTPHTNTTATGVPERGLTVVLATHFQPEKFMSATQAKDAGAFESIFIFLVAAVVSGYVAFVFLKVAFMMVGRLLMFWYLMIASPFAFLSWATPKYNSYFGKWLKDLTNQTFFPVVFLFFLYIIISVLNSGILNALAPTELLEQGMMDGIIIIVLKTLLIIMAIQKAAGVAEKMSGEAGTMMSSWGMKAVGLAARTTMPLAAGVLRNTLGAGMHAVNRSGVFQNMANRTTPASAGLLGSIGGAAIRMSGRAGTATTRAVGNASMDVRGFGLVRRGAKAAGIDVGAPKKLKPGQAGGFSGAVAERQEKQIKKAVAHAETLKITDDERGDMKARKKHNDAVVEGKVHEEKKLINKYEASVATQAKTTEEAKKTDDASPEKKAYDEALKAYADMTERAKTGPIEVAEKNKLTHERDKAERTYKTSPTHTAFVDATALLDHLMKIQKEAEKDLATARKKAQDDIKKTEGEDAFDDVDTKINAENDRRMEVVAKRIESGFNMHSSRSAQIAAEKIRKAGSDKGRAQAKKDKENAEMLKKLTEELQKNSEGKGGKPTPPAGKKPDDAPSDDGHGH